MVKEPKDKDRTEKPKSMLSSPRPTTQNSLSSKRLYCDFLLKKLPSMLMWEDGWIFTNVDPEKWYVLPIQWDHRILFREHEGGCVGKESREVIN